MGPACFHCAVDGGGGGLVLNHWKFVVITGTVKVGKVVAIFLKGYDGGTCSNLESLVCGCSTVPFGDHMRPAKTNNHIILG